MTSGLFNTGGTGVSHESTSFFPAVQAFPVTTTTQAPCQEDVSDEAFHAAFDMDMFDDLGPGFDCLGDESLDSFTDLSAFLSENTFLDQLDADQPMPLNALIDEEVKVTPPSLKRSFDVMEAGSSDIDVLSANVGVSTASNLDHDYSSKRPRMSAATEEVSSVEELFLPPPPTPSVSHTPSTSYTPTPSTSFIIVDAVAPEKARNRREKNNVASKRSRESRKQKFVNMEEEADRLVEENAHLEKRVVVLERLAKQMREMLVAKMAAK